MRRGTLRLMMVLLSSMAIALGLTGVAQARQHHVTLLNVHGIINPVVERFIARGVEQAEGDGSALVVIQLDTPGGELDSTRKITQHLLNAQVPSVVFVAPRGARAASAGTFIAAAANFAVMAPGTNIGAASPVASGGEDLPPTLKSKAFADAAAEMRSIATLRGRNADKLEATVLQAQSFTAEEAVEYRMADFTAGDLDELLAKLDGQQAQLSPPGGSVVVLATQGTAVDVVEFSLVERFLRFISDPNISFLLLSLGGLGLLVELINPGLVAPGVVGAILLILAFLAFGNLPVNWAGVALILLAVVLALLEAYVSGFGVLGVGAIVSFILGSMLLFFHTGAPSPTMPRVGVSLWVLVPTVVVLAGGGGWVFWTIMKSRREQPGVYTPSILGATGYVVTELAPRGTVQVAGEEWTAISENRETIRAGQEIRVIRTSGNTLTVVPLDVTPEGRTMGDEPQNKGTPPDTARGG